MICEDFQNLKKEQREKDKEKVRERERKSYKVIQRTKKWTRQELKTARKENEEK